ncbi:hypothetical protein [Anaeromyxobacter oryzisoli]|uniref:hypothetical protein n=1 Tax=Anaeromyxobacter oryzisoli TaxID=2925408 RepID=UPI001F5A99D7|nr:hypothetical protein [Anaeromyxobacter sp. SG63]
MRLLLVLVLVNGIVPDLAEAGEAVVHCLRTGHVAHCAMHRGDPGRQCDEHGCGSTHHRCTCCASQPLAAVPSEVVVSSLAGEPERPLAPSAVELPARAPSRPFRPPIA